jgi:hypothetical protein
MASLGYVVPVSQQSKETFHGLRRTTQGLLYYTKINKDQNTTIDLSNGVSPVQLPVSGGYVDENISLQSVQYFTGDNSTTQFTMSPPVLNETRIIIFVNGVEQKEGRDYTYSSPTVTFLIKPFNGAQVAVGLIDKEYKNNTTDKYQQYIFEDGEATYFVDADGYLIKRENIGYNLTALGSDDFNTFENTSTVSTTSWQSYV